MLSLRQKQQEFDKTLSEYKALYKDFEKYCLMREGSYHDWVDFENASYKHLNPANSNANTSQPAIKGSWKCPPNFPNLSQWRTSNAYWCYQGSSEGRGCNIKTRLSAPNKGTWGFNRTFPNCYPEDDKILKGPSNVQLKGRPEIYHIRDYKIYWIPQCNMCGVNFCQNVRGIDEAFLKRNGLEGMIGARIPEFCCNKMKSSPAKNLKWLGWTPAKARRGQLEEGEGDCDSHRDCKGRLKCFERNNYEKVPGVNGRGVRGGDYCYDPNPIPSDLGGSCKSILNGPGFIREEGNGAVYFIKNSKIFWLSRFNLCGNNLANQVRTVTNGFIARNKLGKVGQRDPRFTCDMLKDNSSSIINLGKANNLLACKEKALKYSGNNFSAISFVSKDAAVEQSEKNQCYGINNASNLSKIGINGVTSASSTLKSKCTDNLRDSLKKLETKLNEQLRDMENQLQLIYPAANAQVQQGKVREESMLKEVTKVKGNQKKLDELRNKVKLLERKSTDDGLKSTQAGYVNAGLFILIITLMVVFFRKLI